MIPDRRTIVLLSALCIAPASADLAHDARLEAALRNTIGLKGELVDLQTGDDRFLGIHTPSGRRNTRGGVILLHGPWNNLNDASVIRPLRLGLARAGWETLSIQLPTAFPAESPTAWLVRHPTLSMRVATGVQWLSERGNRNQIVLAQGASAAVMLRYMAAGSSPTVRGLVMISTPLDADAPELAGLGTLTIPLLDIHAERDHAAVLAGRVDRRSAAAGNARGGYSQREVTGAIAGFPRLHQSLLTTVRAWLATRVDGREEAQR